LDTAPVCPTPSVSSSQATDAGVTTTVRPAHSALPLQVMDETMTALQFVPSGPDMSSTLARGEGRGNVLDFVFVPRRDDSAPEETLCCFPETRHGNGTIIEEHELGPSLVNNPGPPFKLGDVILCNIPGQLWGMEPKVACLQQGFVMEAAHPSYKIQLEQGGQCGPTPENSG
jgi:hypothetical protein